MSIRSGAIGIFDSGFGGLTVLKSLINVLPDESFVYLGDSARLPYGTKSLETIRKYLEQNIAFLKKLEVKAIVIACNSASSALDPQDSFGLPVFDVIQPGAEAAIQKSKNKKIGVIGTRATTQQCAYVDVIQSLAPEATVYQQACPLFVPLVEEGWEDDPLTNLIVHRYLSPLLQKDIDTLILGCTHYPVLKKAIQKVLRSHSLSTNQSSALEDIHIIDSAEAIAQIIQEKINHREIEKGKSDHPKVHLLATDLSVSSQEVASRILSPKEMSPLELVSIT